MPNNSIIVAFNTLLAERGIIMQLGDTTDSLVSSSKRRKISIRLNGDQIVMRRYHKYPTPSSDRTHFSLADPDLVKKVCKRYRQRPS